MRCASICLGVVDYVSDHYRQSSLALRFAASDAEAFFQYSKAISDARDDAARHHLIVNGDANFITLNKAFASVESIGSLDLFILYLSGHGEVDGDAFGWFCLVDARPEFRALTVGNFVTCLIRSLLSILLS